MALYRDHVLPCLTHLTMSNPRLIEYRRRVVSQPRSCPGNRDRVRPQFPLPDIAPRRGTEIPQCTFGRLLVNSGLSLAIVLGMTVNDVSGKAIANLGWKKIKLRLRYSAVTRSVRNPRSWKSGNRSYGPRRELSLCILLACK